MQSEMDPLQGEHDAMKCKGDTSLEPSGSAGSAKAQTCRWRHVTGMLFSGLLLVVAGVAAAVSFNRYLVYEFVTTEIKGVCYGRYQMCLEENWWANMDYSPRNNEDINIALWSVVRPMSYVTDSVKRSWEDHCSSNYSQEFHTLHDDAPWFCPCLEEIVHRCYSIRPEYNRYSRGDAFGAYERSEDLKRAYNIKGVADVTAFVAWAAFGVGIVVMVHMVGVGIIRLLKREFR